MRSRPASSASRAALTSAGQSSGLAPLRCRPVSTLRCTAAGVPVDGIQDAVELGEGRHAQLDVGLDRGGEVGPLTVEPREQRHLDPGLAQLDRRRAPRARPARPRRPRSPRGRTAASRGRRRSPSRRSCSGRARPSRPATRTFSRNAARSRISIGPAVMRAPPSRRIRAPRPAVRSRGSRSVAVAHSCALGAPAAGSPNSTASLPSSGHVVAAVDDELVHRDAADERMDSGADVHGRAVRGEARHAVGVPECDEGQGGRGRGAVAVAVRDAGVGADVLDGDHLADEGHHGAGRRIRIEAVRGRAERTGVAGEPADDAPRRRRIARPRHRARRRRSTEATPASRATGPSRASPCPYASARASRDDAPAMLPAKASRSMRAHASDARGARVSHGFKVPAVRDA